MSIEKKKDNEHSDYIDTYSHINIHSNNCTADNNYKNIEANTQTVDKKNTIKANQHHSIFSINTEEDITKKPLLQRVENFSVKHRDKLVFVHMVMFVLFTIFIITPLFLSTPTKDSTIFNHFTTFANFAIWGLWAPLVFLSVIFTGRSWCGLLCPMGAATEFVNKKGLQLNIPAWLRWEGTPVISFILVAIWGQTVGVQTHHEAIAIVFGTTMVAAIIIGFFFGKNKRAWCRHACPIGLLLGVFSRISIFNFANKNPKEEHGRYAEKGLCPNMIKISCKDESRHCIQCLRCVNPKSKSGLKMEFRYAGEEVENIKKHNPNKAEVWFLFMAIGVILARVLLFTDPSYQLLRSKLEAWFISNNWTMMFESSSIWVMRSYPEHGEVFNWLDFTAITLYILVLMVIFAAILAIGVAISTYMTKNVGRKGRVFVELSYQYMPIVMASIAIGLGGVFFNSLSLLGLSGLVITNIKIMIFGLALLWSMRIGYKILNNMDINRAAAIILTIPTSLCGLAIGYGWLIAVAPNHIF